MPKPHLNTRVATAYEEYCAAEVERFIANELPAGEYAELFKEHREKNRAMFRLMTDAQIEHLTHGTVRSALEKSGRVRLLCFNDFLNGPVSNHQPATSPQF